MLFQSCDFELGGSPHWVRMTPPPARITKFGFQLSTSLWKVKILSEMEIKNLFERVLQTQLLFEKSLTRNTWHNNTTSKQRTPLILHLDKDLHNCYITGLM